MSQGNGKIGALSLNMENQIAEIPFISPSMSGKSCGIGLPSAFFSRYLVLKAPRNGVNRGGNWSLASACSPAVNGLGSLKNTTETGVTR